MAEKVSATGQLPQGWRRYAVRTALTRTMSLTLTSQVVLALIVGLIEMSWGGQPMLWNRMLILIVALIVPAVVFYFVERRSIARQPNPGQSEYQLMSLEQLKEITDIVTVAPSLFRNTPNGRVATDWNAGVLYSFCKPSTRVLQLTGLRTVRIIVAQDDDLETSRTKIDAFAKENDIKIKILSARPSRHSFTDADVDMLAESLTRQAGDVAEYHGKLAVDITADTKLIGLTLFEAARIAGLSATYVQQEHHDHNDDPFMLYEISTPAGSLSRGQESAHDKQ